MKKQQLPIIHQMIVWQVSQYGLDFYQAVFHSKYGAYVSLLFNNTDLEEPINMGGYITDGTVSHSNDIVIIHCSDHNIFTGGVKFDNIQELMAHMEEYYG